MRQDTRVLSNPWRWIVIAVWASALLIGIGILTESAPEIASETDRAISTAIGIGIILGSLNLLVITWRKRVVLSRESMLVCRGVRTRRYRREDVVGARYYDELHEVAKYPICYPVVDAAEGGEIKLPFLAHRLTGGGLRRVENYIGDINDWVAANRK
jgi:hypothetical protein